MTTFGYQKQQIVSAANTAGIAASQTPVAGGPLTLVSNPVVLPNGGQRISITSAANLSARTFTFVGIDNMGRSATVAVAGPNAVTQVYPLTLAQVISVSVDAATGAALTVGWAAEADFTLCAMDLKQNPTSISYMGVIVSGAPTFDGQYTLEDIWADTGVAPRAPAPIDPGSWVWFTDPNMTAKAVSSDSVITKPITALRIHVNGVGTMRMVVWQAMNPGGGR